MYGIRGQLGKIISSMGGVSIKIRIISARKADKEEQTLCGVK
jgi:uncharacterized DUF497 family protein